MTAPVICCDECGRPVDNPYRLARFQGRMPALCGPCLEKIARSIAMVTLAAARRKIAA